MLISVCLILAGCGAAHVADADNEHDANKMFSILHSNGFEVVKTSPSGENKVWKISVNESWFGDDEAAEATNILLDYGLPRRPAPKLKENDTLGMSSDRREIEEQRLNLQAELERKFYAYPGVLDAFVTIGQPTNETFGAKSLPTASVTLIVKADESRLTDEDLKNIMSSGIPNLTPENVAVKTIPKTVRRLPEERRETNKQRKNIFAVGIGVIILLSLALGTLWVYTRKRNRTENGDPPSLIEDDEDLDSAYENGERTLLNDGNDSR